MNKFHKSVYSEVLRTWIAVSEITKNGRNKARSRIVNVLAKLGFILFFLSLVGDAFGYKTDLSNEDSGNNSSAIGYNNHATGESSTAIGDSNYASGNKSNAIGVNNRVNLAESTALGYQNQVLKEKSSAIGLRNYNEGSNSFSYGLYNFAIGTYSNAFGSNNFSIGDNSTTIGFQSYSGDIELFSTTVVKNNQSPNGIQLNALESKINELKGRHNLQTASSVRGLAIGYQSFALNIDSISVGNNSISSGNSSLAFGNEAISLKYNDVAIGTRAYAGYSDYKFDYVKIASRNWLIDSVKPNAISSVANQNDSSSEIAIGTDAVAMGTEIIAVGSTNRAFGRQSSAMGKGNFSHGTSAHSFGNWNISYGNNTLTLGSYNDSKGDKSIAAGFENKAYGSFSTAIGYYNLANSEYSSVVGNSNQAYGYYSTSIGSGNVAGWNNALIYPELDRFASSPTSSESLTKEVVRTRFDGERHNQIVAVGVNNAAFGEKSTAVGSRNLTLALSSVSIGKSNLAEGVSSQAIGDWNTAKGSNSNSIGYKNIVDVGGNFSSAIGILNYVTNVNSYAYGGHNAISSSNSSTFGLKNFIHNNSDYSSAIGYLNNLTGTSSNIFGSQNSVSNSYSLALGTGNSISGSHSIAIGSGVLNRLGNSTEVSENSIVSANYAISIGNQNIVDAVNTVALGSYVQTNGISNSVILGNHSVGAGASNIVHELVQFGGLADELNISSFWSGRSELSKGSISVGDRDKERQIKNVATGDVSPLSTDAINGSQLYSAIHAIGEVSLIIEGDLNNFGRKLGQKLVINGGAHQDNLSDDNIGILVQNEKLIVKLSKSINGLTSVALVGGIKLNNNGLMIENGPSFTRNRIDVYNNRISNVTSDNQSAEHDAANVGLVRNSINELRLEGIQFLDDTNEKNRFHIGSEVNFTGDENISSTSTRSGIKYSLSKSLQKINSLDITNGPTLNNEGIDLRGKEIKNVFTSPDAPDNHVANIGFVKEKIREVTQQGYSIKDNNSQAKFFGFGSSIEFTGDQNINSSLTNEGMRISLNPQLEGLTSISFYAGPILNSDGLVFDNNHKIARKLIKLGVLTIDDTGLIDGVVEPKEDSHAANKLYVDKKIGEVENKPVIFETNLGLKPIYLNNSLFIKGSDENHISEEFSASNIMTWFDRDVLRIGLRKKLRSSNLIVDKSSGINSELTPNSLIFNSINGKVSLEVINLGSEDKDGNTISRLKVNDIEVATMNDGLSFSDNLGNTRSVNLNQKISFLGGERNINPNLFDDGKNIITELIKDGDGIKYTISLKKSPELENITLNGSENDSPSLFLKDKSGLDKIQAYIDDGNGIVTTVGSDGNQSTDLMHDGLAINDRSGYSKFSYKNEGIGSIDSLTIKKRRLTHTYDLGYDTKTEEIATLEDGFIFSGNTKNEESTKLNSKVKIAGSEANKNWSEFDNGENIMTKVETGSSGETIIRIAMRKNLQLKNGDIGGDGTKGELNIKQEDGSTGLTLNPDKIIFNNINKLDENGNPQKNGSAGISMTQNGKSDLVNKGPATRILITNSKGDPISEVATMNDGLKFGANTGDEVSNLLNSKVIVAGNKQNTDWTEFDEGKNIMTKVEQNKEGQTDITIALKRDVELDSATFGHGATTEQNAVKPKEGKDGRIKLVNKDGETTIQIDAGKSTDSNGPAISISKPNSEEGTKLTSEGFEIRKKSHTTKDSDKSKTKTSKAFVSIAPEGSARIEQDSSQKRTRLTLKSGEGDSSIVEEIATMNDGLRFKGDSEELINKPLSSTLSIVGGETDANNLTSSKEDKNIGVIVEDIPRAAKDSNAKSKKVLAVRLSKNLKGLQSAEFKPVDDKGKSTGQTITLGKEGLTISNKDKKAQLNEEGLKIGENGPSVTEKGINAGGMNISNVAPPTQPHHASTKGYVDTQVKYLENKINERYKDGLGASAMAMATSGLMPPSPGKSAFAVASAVVAGQPAFAMGLTTITENGKIMFKGAVASDARGQVGGLVGAAYQW